MNKTQRLLFYFFVLTASAAWILLTSAPARNAPLPSAPQSGFPAPDFSLPALDGKTYTLSELKGNAVLVNLWATWCPPCRAEMPAIEKIYQEYKDKGFVVLAVNMTTQDDPFAVAPFVQEYGLTFPVLLDENALAAAAYQMRSLPSSYFIDRAGIIREVVIGGPMAEALLRTRVEQILR